MIHGILVETGSLTVTDMRRICKATEQPPGDKTMLRACCDAFVYLCWM